MLSSDQSPPLPSVLLCSFMFMCMVYRLMTKLCSQAFKAFQVLASAHLFSLFLHFLFQCTYLSSFCLAGTLLHLLLPMQFSHQILHHGRQGPAQFGPPPLSPPPLSSLPSNTWNFKHTEAGQASSLLITCCFFCLGNSSLPPFLFLPCQSLLIFQALA